MVPCTRTQTVKPKKKTFPAHIEKKGDKSRTNPSAISLKTTYHLVQFLYLKPEVFQKTFFERSHRLSCSSCSP